MPPIKLPSFVEYVAFRLAAHASKEVPPVNRNTNAIVAALGTIQRYSLALSVASAYLNQFMSDYNLWLANNGGDHAKPKQL